MRVTRVLWQHRQPLIRFLGKRSTHENIDHSPHAHPAAPDHSLPESFAQYRDRATQHGPLGGNEQQQRQRKGPTVSGPAAGGSQGARSDAYEFKPYGAIGGHSGHELGSVEPGKGEVWDRDELPARFRRKIFSEEEIDAVDTAGASLWR